jgi:hypothetical protein|tara:strand:- start:2142 stop:2387 length:246 start_codon:yes stop_codon:yes gene_type:complete
MLGNGTHFRGNKFKEKEKANMIDVEKIEWMYKQLKDIKEKRSKWIQKSTLENMLEIVNDLRDSWDCIYFTDKWECLKEKEN